MEQANSFHAVLSEEELDAENAIQLTETVCLSEHRRFQVETQPRISRTNEALIEIAKPLLRHSRQVKWVDRFFDPGDRHKTSPLKHMLCWLREQVPQLHEMQLHVERSEAFSNSTKAHYSREIGRMLPGGFLIKVFFWKPATENLHPRFLLTDVGGLQYDYGLDHGNLPTETTIVNLTTPGRLKDEWLRYSLDSQDLDLDRNEHVLEVTAFARS